jgi:hypothetical protein
VELVANGIKGGTAGNKGSATGTGAAGAAGVSAGAGGVGFLLFFLGAAFFPLPIIEEIPPMIAPLQQQRRQMSNTHNQLGKIEPEDPDQPELLPLLSGKLLLELPEDAYEPESVDKELDPKELDMVKDCKEVAELLDEPPEEVNHEAEEDIDESQAVIVVVF